MPRAYLAAMRLLSFCRTIRATLWLPPDDRARGKGDTCPRRADDGGRSATPRPISRAPRPKRAALRRRGAFARPRPLRPQGLVAWQYEPARLLSLARVRNLGLQRPDNDVVRKTSRKGAYGIRTRAAAVRGRCPRPLDECAGDAQFSEQPARQFR